VENDPLPRSRASQIRAEKARKLFEPHRRRGEFLRARTGSRSAGKSGGPRDGMPFLLVRFLMWPSVNRFIGSLI